MNKFLWKTIATVLGLLGARLVIGQTVTEFEMPGGGQPAGIVAAPDGDFWFTENAADSHGRTVSSWIGRITPAGVITELPIPVSHGISGEPENSGGLGIAVGPDGNIWFTESWANKICRFTAAGALTAFEIPTTDSFPQGIIVGPDENLWFVEQNGNKIGRVSTDGAVLGEVAIPTPVSNAANLVLGPDGAVWFTEQSGNKVGRMTPTGAVTEFPIPTADSIPHGITVGPDGHLWFVEGQGKKVARITVAGLITEYPVDHYPLNIVSGPDGNLWYVSEDSFVGRVTPSGVVTEFPAAAAFAAAVGRDGRIWFTEQGSSGIANVTTGPCVADAVTLCLEGSRFRMRANWSVPSETRSGPGRAVILSDRAGYFWFFDVDDPDVVVKMLNGCLVNGDHWVFAGGLTNVEVTLTVTDMETGLLQTYTNASGVPYQPIQDTAAFVACPQ